VTIDSVREASCPLIFVVSGPSGSGKTSLCARALQDLPWVRPSISHTTRRPREGERDGQDYFFVDRCGFQEMVRQGAFLEWAEVHGQLYGTSRGNLESVDGGRAVLFEVDCQGAGQIQRHLPQAVLIFVMTPSFEDLVQRIRNRGPITAEELEVRIRTAREEVRRVRAFQYVVINDRFPDASLAFLSILRAHRCLRDRVLPGRVEGWEAEIRGYETLP